MTSVQANLRNGFDEFHAEIFAQIAGTGVEVAFPDYERGSTRPVDLALERWHDSMEALRMAQPHHRWEDEWLCRSLGYTIYRNHYLIGSIGCYLAEQRPSDDALIECGLLTGTTHIGVGDFMAHNRVNVDYVGQTREKMPEDLQVFIQGVGQAALSLEQRTHILSQPS